MSDATSGARSVGRPRLPVTRIVDVALELVDEHGADALTMRTLAQRLGSGTATLYRHFDDRSALVAAIADRLLSRVSLDETALRDATWQDALVLVTHSAFDVLQAHPRAASLFVELPRGPNGMQLRELGLSLLLANGFTPELAVRVWATVSRYVLGFATQLPSESADAPAPPRPDVDRAFRQSYPATCTVLEFGPVALADEFAFGLQLLVAGLTATHRTG